MKIQAKQFPWIYSFLFDLTYVFGHEFFYLNWIANMIWDLVVFPVLVIRRIYGFYWLISFIWEKKMYNDMTDFQIGIHISYLQQWWHRKLKNYIKCHVNVIDVWTYNHNHNSENQCSLPKVNLWCDSILTNVHKSHSKCQHNVIQLFKLFLVMQIDHVLDPEGWMRQRLPILHKHYDDHECSNYLAANLM